MLLFLLACLRHIIGLIKSEWPIARQERDRCVGGLTARINKRRNLGEGRDRERQNRMREKEREAHA